jgi:hypothetical protein
MISTEALEDADSESTLGGAASAVTTHDGEGRFGIREISDEERERTQQRIAETLRLARLLDVQPAAGEGADEDLFRRYEDAGENHELRVLLGSLLLANRTQRPLYTDDRWIREFARAVGVQGFGTLALTEVLTARAVMTPDQRRGVRRRLASSRAWGICFSGEELSKAARDTKFSLDDVLIGALNDRAAWRGRPGDFFQELSTFFAAAHAEAPETFRLWVRRAIDAAQRSLPHMHPSWSAEVMLVMAWGLEPDSRPASDACFQALVDEIKRLPPGMTTLGYDALLGAINHVLTYFEGRPDPERFHLLLWLIRRLRLTDQERALQTFAQFVA